MRRLSIILLFSLLATAANAQRIHAFLSSGMTVNQIEGDELKGFKHFGYTGGVGALAAISSNNQWGISSRILFLQAVFRFCNGRRRDHFVQTVQLSRFLFK